MGLKFHPEQGAILICDYSTGFILPKMIKKRPVVVISPRPRRGKHFGTVIPLSTTIPNPVERYHHLLHPLSLPGKFSERETWAKCDMIATVSLDRLDRIKLGKDVNGKRVYTNHVILANDLKAIKKGVLVTLGINLPFDYNR
jgi:mRNA interferase MazF